MYGKQAVPAPGAVADGVRWRPGRRKLYGVGGETEMTAEHCDFVLYKDESLVEDYGKGRDSVRRPRAHVGADEGYRGGCARQHSRQVARTPRELNQSSIRLEPVALRPNRTASQNSV